MNGRVGELYRKWRPEGTYDAIVIGSGIGGLSVAALLAKHDGRRVLVLERHTTAGGFTHTFSRKGYEWDVGLHYIGQVGRGSMLRALFDEVTDGALEWAPMGEVYDTVVIGNERWEYVTGRDAWRERLVEYFPDETGAIDSYLDRVREAIGSSQGFFAEKAVSAPLALLAGPWMRRRFLRHANRTVGEVLDGLTDNPTLKAILCAQLGDYGLPPARASFAIHAMVFNHYLGGGAYPVGGSARIAEAMAPLIEATGGQIVIGAEVSTVLVEGGRAVGVWMADGRELSAELVISDAGVPNTVFRLLPEGTPGRDALVAVSRATTPSAADPAGHRAFGLPRLSLCRSRANRLGARSRPVESLGLPEHRPGRRLRPLPRRSRCAAAFGFHLVPVGQGPRLRPPLPRQGYHRDRQHGVLRPVQELDRYELDEARRGLRGSQGGSVTTAHRGARTRGAAGQGQDCLPRAVDTTVDPPLR